jgi:hypothetical protein
MSGCVAKYSAKAVVPHFGAPTIKKSGRFLKFENFPRVASPERLIDDSGINKCPKLMRPKQKTGHEISQTGISQKHHKNARKTEFLESNITNFRTAAMLGC